MILEGKKVESNNTMILANVTGNDQEQANLSVSLFLYLSEALSTKVMLTLLDVVVGLSEALSTTLSIVKKLSLP